MADVTDAGVLTTASDLLFSGGREGYVFALDAETGALLWKANVGGRCPGPMTYLGGRQYVAFAAGSSLFVTRCAVSYGWRSPHSCTSGRVRRTCRPAARVTRSRTPPYFANSRQHVPGNSPDDAVAGGDEEHPADDGRTRHDERAALPGDLVDGGELARRVELP